ncbi:Aste57867_10891 [Aphanomyces stellatus]|uniref:Aste57867_10891 protein n=1 Tax=Aphanomyces stellatus TaxID=120398 RepID=A0A485KSP5_9STRA|nr:hypothetical protein As57867_010851 [Aphanomyces stellatus]VFT87759.1 Aste57867_10891 [Aphanomyces stellatus]
MEEGASSSVGSPKRRTALPREARNNVSSYNESSFQPYMESFHKSPKRAKTNAPKPANAPAATAIVAAESDDEERKEKFEIGDCVLVSNNDDEYVALVCSLQSSSLKAASKFTALWYYRVEDVDKDALAKVDGGVLENEVFQSSDRDTNSVEHVVGKCQVISELDFRDRQNVFRLGQLFDEEEQIFVCRYKYDPKLQSIEPIKEPEDIRLGLGKSQPNIGDEFQATDLPTCTRPATGAFLGTHIWSPSTLMDEPYAFKKFMSAVEGMRFGLGAVVKYYHKFSGGAVTGAHCRAVVCKLKDKDTAVICPAASGCVVVEVLKTNLCSVFLEDRAMHHFHTTRRNYAAAMEACTREFKALQVEEKKMFRREMNLNLTKQ